MLIPLHVGRLLLPNAVVAEIIGYREPDASGTAPIGLQGTVNWRQRELPVVDFERLTGAHEQAPGIRQRIAVCYGPDPHARWPLIGLVAQGIPRLLRLEIDAIDTAERGPHGASAIRLRLDVAGERLVVPDLAYLQARLS
jgi:chemosensory pili system protein ChpC